MMFLGETITMTMIGGCLLVFLGTILTVSRPKPGTAD
jgi:drug/metabolite transporter (DMT)-like permease